MANLEYLRQIVNPRKVVYEYNMDFLDWIASEDRKACLLKSG